APQSIESAVNAVYLARKKYKVGTAEIKRRIQELLAQEKAEGKPFTELLCGVLHKKWELKNAVAMVCNAMKASMNEGDVVVFSSPSGYSATLKIRYYHAGAAGADFDATKETKSAVKPNIANTTDIKLDAIIAARADAKLPKKADLADVGAAKPLPNPAAKPKTPPSPGEVWRRILEHEWVIFYLPDGGEFAYVAGNDYLSIVRSNYRLPRADIEKALTLYPFKNTVPLQHLRYPAYLFAILTDERIVG
ncbi:MAG: hypothetical protein FWE84_02055, partial [Firmicutes bacterium]|nr:hypothetical protein [Bacillota bacterium]